jgi:hypothetical protein
MVHGLGVRFDIHVRIVVGGMRARGRWLLHKARIPSRPRRGIATTRRARSLSLASRVIAIVRPKSSIQRFLPLVPRVERSLSLLINLIPTVSDLSTELVLRPRGASTCRSVCGRTEEEETGAGTFEAFAVAPGVGGDTRVDVAVEVVDAIEEDWICGMR